MATSLAAVSGDSPSQNEVISLAILMSKSIFIRYPLFQPLGVGVHHVPVAPREGHQGDASLLRQLKEMIEMHFRTKHSGGEYAELLNVSIKTLGRIVKNYFQRTLTEIISERIILEAKRELNLSARGIKEIAYDLGFKDEYHFSRYFKNKVKVSPQLFRNSLRNARYGPLKSVKVQDAETSGNPRRKQSINLGSLAIVRDIFGK